MVTSRRLPPLNAVSAFVAAARHMSFMTAGEELSVAPGAIGRTLTKVRLHAGLAGARLCADIGADLSKLPGERKKWIMGHIMLALRRLRINLGCPEFQFQMCNADGAVPDAVTAKLHLSATDEDRTVGCRVKDECVRISAPAVMATPLQQATEEAAAEALIRGKHLRCGARPASFCGRQAASDDVRAGVGRHQSSLDRKYVRRRHCDWDRA